MDGERGWFGWASDSASSLASKIGILSEREETVKKRSSRHMGQAQPEGKSDGDGSHYSANVNFQPGSASRYTGTSTNRGAFNGNSRGMSRGPKNGYSRDGRQGRVGYARGAGAFGGSNPGIPVNSMSNSMRNGIVCTSDNVTDNSGEAATAKQAQMGGQDGPAGVTSAELPSNLLAILECPVCMVLYKDKVYICCNGHSICGLCFESLPDQRCPHCRVKLGNIRNRIVEKVLETSSLPCVYREYGCSFLGRGDARMSHEEKCMFRPIPCLLKRCYPSCKWEGTPSMLVEHLNTHCSVREVKPGKWDDVYWSYRTDKECFQRGKDAAYYLPWCQRFYYVSISKRGELFHLAALWFAISPKAATEAHRAIKMELEFPLDNDQKVSYSLYPPQLLQGEVLDGQISELIEKKLSFIVPIHRWRREWSETKHKCYFQVRARWEDPQITTREKGSTVAAAPASLNSSSNGGGIGMGKGGIRTSGNLECGRSDNGRCNSSSDSGGGGVIIGTSSAATGTNTEPKMGASSKGSLANHAKSNDSDQVELGEFDQKGHRSDVPFDPSPADLKALPRQTQSFDAPRRYDGVVHYESSGMDYRLSTGSVGGHGTSGIRSSHPGGFNGANAGPRGENKTGGNPGSRGSISNTNAISAANEHEHLFGVQSRMFQLHIGTSRSRPLAQMRRSEQDSKSLPRQRLGCSGGLERNGNDVGNPPDSSFFGEKTGLFAFQASTSPPQGSSFGSDDDNRPNSNNIIRPNPNISMDDDTISTAAERRRESGLDDSDIVDT